MVYSQTIFAEKVGEGFCLCDHLWREIGRLVHDDNYNIVESRHQQARLPLGVDAAPIVAGRYFRTKGQDSCYGEFKLAH